ncbi:Ferric siderophore transport system, periplasmic binding protein TonB [hydrothermal vent metagenome]|uniref:Ferric siderophore transport system, periplasmic binding protein TonB n=1 Tax=hydrothermal vent metagenome TaxID=652676 RepID=A0A1W1D0N1_9ZZZZ
MSNNYYEDYLAKTNNNLRESTLLKQETQHKSSKKGILLIILFLVLAGEGFYLWQKNQETQANVDNPTETLLPMTKPTENLEAKEEIILPEVIEKEPEEEIILPEVVEKAPKEEIILPKVVKKEPKKEIILPKVVKKEPKEEIILPKVVKKEPKKEKSKEEIKKHPLEISLLKADKETKHPDTTDKKIDTFNKVILDSSITEPNPTAKKLVDIIKASKVKKEEPKEKDKKTAYTDAITDEAKVRKDEMRYVTVKSGDSLYKIAKRTYGDATYFEVIFKANSDVLKSKTDLKIGQKLRVPKLKKAE